MVVQGSIPWVLVGALALFLVLCRYVYIRLVSTASDNKTKEVTMAQTIKCCMRALIGSIFETIWAIGVSIIAGSQLLT